jgi:hypothetical protein
MILVLLAILLGMYQYEFTVKLSQSLPSQLSKFFMIGAIVSIAGTVLGIFAVWVIVAAILHGVSALFEGRGSFRRTFEFSGYGFLPSLVGSMITVPASLYYIKRANPLEVDVELLSSDPWVIKEAIKSIIPAEWITASTVINLAVVAWSMVLWTFAVKNARNVRLRNAVICATVPTTILAAYQFYTLLQLY